MGRFWRPRRPTTRSTGLLIAAAVLLAGCSTSTASPSIAVLRTVAPTPSAFNTVEAVTSVPSASAPSTPLPRLVPGTSCGVTSAYFARAAAPQRPDPAVPQAQALWARTASTVGLGSLSVSPDGELLAVSGRSGSTSVAQLWADDGTKVADLRDGDSIVCLAWSPDGRVVAGGSTDGKVRLWERSGAPSGTLDGSDPIESLAWSPDGSQLATGAIHFAPAGASGLQQLPGVIRIWSRDRRLIRTLGTQFTGGKFLNLAWSPDGTMLAAGAVDYRVWRADGSPVGVPRNGGTPTWAMAWSPDGSVLALGDENGQLETVTPSGPSVQMHRFESGGVNWLAYSPDGASLALGLDNQLLIVQANSIHKTVWSVDTSGPQIVWSPDGRSVLALDGHGLTVYDSKGTPRKSLAGCAGNVTNYTGNGTVILAVTDAGRVCSWSMTG